MKWGIICFGLVLIIIISFMWSAEWYLPSPTATEQISLLLLVYKELVLKSMNEMLLPLTMEQSNS